MGSKTKIIFISSVVSVLHYCCHTSDLCFFCDIDSVVFTHVITLFFSNPALYQKHFKPWWKSVSCENPWSKTKEEVVNKRIGTRFSYCFLCFFCDIDSVVFTHVITLFFSNPALYQKHFKPWWKSVSCENPWSKTSDTTPATPYPR